MEKNKQFIIGQLKLVEQLARQDNYPEAIRRLDEIQAIAPKEARVWATRAYVNGRRADRDETIASWTRAIALCDRQPHYFYMRGIELFHLARFREAIADFTRVIDLCDSYSSDYYRAGAYFFRADAHLRLKEFEQAKSDCDHVPDDMRTWTDRIRTKAEILALCTA